MGEENLSSKPLIRYVNRQQMSWRAVDVEKLVGEDHPARAIWELVERLDLRPFYEAIESSVKEGGRPAFDPQLLISLWVFAYSQGIGSAREVARRCEFDPAFQWLAGLQEVNYHTLADFRVEKQKELDGLFTQVLAALSKEGLITLEQVMQDGTKIKAQASVRSYQGEGALREHLERARQRVAEMGDPRSEQVSPKMQQARVRARREQQQRLEGALEELQKLQASKCGEKAKTQARVSVSDPQARVMKQSDGGLGLSYNAQISTDAANGLIVGAAVTQDANDSAQLLPAVDRLEQRLGKKPRQVVADGGYTTRENIEKMAGRAIDFLGSLEKTESGVTAPQRLAPSVFIYQPASNRYLCPDRKGDITIKGSMEWWRIATKRNSTTVKPARANQNAARTITDRDVDSGDGKRVRWFARFGKRWTARKRRDSIGSAAGWWNSVTPGSKANWDCGNSTCAASPRQERSCCGLV